MYPDISDKHNFQRPARPILRLGADDAAVICRLLGGQTEPDANDVAQLDRILAVAYGADPAPPGAFEAAVLEHGGRPVLMAVDFSYFLSGCAPRDIPEAIEDCGVCEGTGRLGPPLMDDPVVPDASRTVGVAVTDDQVASEPVIRRDEPPGQGVDLWPDDGERSPMEEGWAKANMLTEEQEARRRELCEAALAYVNAGWRVHPLWHVNSDGSCACRDRDKCKSAGKHPRLAHWGEEASLDPEMVNRWWGPCVDLYSPMFDWYPMANIGLVQDPDRTFVLDVDPDHGGDIELEKLAERLGDNWDLPDTWIVRTGSGGRHFYFLQPEGKPVGNPRLLPRGLDVKGAGGYVLAPPSRTNKGDYATHLDHEIAGPPQWFLTLLEEHDKQQRGEPSLIAPEVVPVGKRRAYAKRAYERTKEKLSNAAVGERNNTLNDCAFALGQLCPPGITDEDTAWAILSEAASACNMREGVQATFLSGWRGGLRKPFWPDWAENEDETEWPLRTWDHFGLADRMADRFADTMRWCSVMRRWQTWQSGRWEPDFPETGEWMARVVVESLFKEEQYRYSDIPDDDGQSPRQKFISWAKGCRNGGAMGGTCRVAKANPLMRINTENCDAEPMWINCRNGCYDASTGEFMDHEPDQLLTMRAAVLYDPAALCPRWDAFLEKVQPDPEMRDFLYRIWGYSMTGDTSEQAIFINHGSGANGKSVALDVISSILGDYAQVVPVESLLMSRDKSGKIPNDVARMRGKRFLKASETHDGRRLDEALIKALTGGEEMVARFMRGEFFQFRPRGKVHLTSNTLVHVTDDDATWRRLHLIPWLITIPPGERNKYLAQQLYEEEAAGIFNRLLSGLAQWRARGALMPPVAAQEAIWNYREQEDALGQALAEAFDIDIEHLECHAACRHITQGPQVYQAYKLWCQQNSMVPMGRTAFYKKLEARGFVRSKYKNLTVFSQLQAHFGGLQV